MSNPIFHPSTVNKQTHLLARMLRLLFTRQRITEEDFYQLHYRYDMGFNKTPYKIQSDRNNLKRILRTEDSLSYGKFKFTVENILNLDVLEHKMVVQDRQTREIFTISSRDSVTDEGDYIVAPPLAEEGK